jgi:uncharacterized protein
VKGLLRRIAVGLALLLALPALAYAAPKFPPLSGRVVDEAGLLSPAAEQKLTGELAALEQKTGHQLVVATLKDLQGYEIEDYGYQLGRTWALGQKGKNDGAILIVAPSQRKVRIEVGYGLEPVLTDALSSLIIQRSILPAFKAGNMEKGVVDGTEAIIAQLGLPPEEAEARARQAIAVQPQDVADVDLAPPILIIIVLVFFGISLVMKVLGVRPRYGGSGGLWWILWALLSSGGGRSSGGGGGWSSGGGGGGGFSGGGGSFGGGGASGGW